jgi:hypothetical protein
MKFSRKLPKEKANNTMVLISSDTHTHTHTHTHTDQKSRIFLKHMYMYPDHKKKFVERHTANCQE